MLDKLEKAQQRDKRQCCLKLPALAHHGLMDAYSICFWPNKILWVKVDYFLVEKRGRLNYTSSKKF